jgi:hypothetical protein
MYYGDEVRKARWLWISEYIWYLCRDPYFCFLPSHYWSPCSASGFTFIFQLFHFSGCTVIRITPCSSISWVLITLNIVINNRSVHFALCHVSISTNGYTSIVCSLYRLGVKRFVSQQYIILNAPVPSLCAFAVYWCARSAIRCTIIYVITKRVLLEI